MIVFTGSLSKIANVLSFTTLRREIAILSGPFSVAVTNQLRSTRNTEPFNELTKHDFAES